MGDSKKKKPSSNKQSVSSIKLFDSLIDALAEEKARRQALLVASGRTPRQAEKEVSTYADLAQELFDKAGGFTSMKGRTTPTPKVLPKKGTSDSKNVLALPAPLSHTQEFLALLGQVRGILEGGCQAAAMFTTNVDALIEKCGEINERIAAGVGQGPPESKDNNQSSMDSAGRTAEDAEQALGDNDQGEKRDRKADAGDGEGTG